MINRSHAGPHPGWGHPRGPRLGPGTPGWVPHPWPWALPKSPGRLGVWDHWARLLGTGGVGICVSVSLYLSLSLSGSFSKQNSKKVLRWHIFRYSQFLLLTGRSCWSEHCQHDIPVQSCANFSQLEPTVAILKMRPTWNQSGDRQLSNLWHMPHINTKLNQRGSTWRQLDHRQVVELKELQNDERLILQSVSKFRCIWLYACQFMVSLDHMSNNRGVWYHIAVSKFNSIRPSRGHKSNTRGNHQWQSQSPMKDQSAEIHQTAEIHVAPERNIQGQSQVFKWQLNEHKHKCNIRLCYMRQDGAIWSDIEWGSFEPWRLMYDKIGMDMWGTLT